MKKPVLALLGVSLFSPLAFASQPGFHQSLVSDLELQAEVFQALRDCKASQVKINTEFQYIVYPESDKSCNFHYITPVSNVKCSLPARERHVVAQEHLTSIYHQLYTAYASGQFTGQLETAQANKIMHYSPYCVSRK